MPSSMPHETRRDGDLGSPEAEMKRASKALEFERAADIRDEIQRLKRLLPDPDMLPGKKAAARSR